MRRWMRQPIPVQRGSLVGTGCLGLGLMSPWHALGGALFVTFIVLQVIYGRVESLRDKEGTDG